MTYESPAALPPVTSVDVVDLSGIDASRVDQYMRQAGDAPFVRLHAVEAERIAALWRALPSGESARCHIPPYGVRFRVGDGVVCQASICWQCDNIYGDAEGRPFGFAFDACHSTSRGLLEALRRAMGGAGGGVDV